MNKSVRLKPITIDGATFVIASLSLKQGRELQRKSKERSDQVKANPPATPPSDTDLMDSPSMANLLEMIVCASLNRSIEARDADKDDPPEARWTTARCIDDLDFRTIDFLMDEILDFSGIARTSKEGASPLAESPIQEKTVAVAK